MLSSNNTADPKLISVIVPVYNEEDTIGLFFEEFSRIKSLVKNYSLQLLFVNDGSIDATRRKIDDLSRQNDDVSVIHLSRNFGKEAAMSAGLDFAAGAAVAIFDVDLQDPLDLLPKFIECWEAGYDVAYAKRTHRQGETWLKKITATLFYRFIGKFSNVKIPADTGDCRLMSRRVVDEIVKLRENHRFMKGIFSWVGFPSVAVEFERKPRSAGTTKFNYFKLWNFAVEGITSFSIAPLKVATYLGFFMSLGAFLFGVWVILKTVIFGEIVQGYPTLMVSILFLSGIQIMFMGIIGEYVGRIFGESKSRPIYVVESIVNGKCVVGAKEK